MGLFIVEWVWWQLLCVQLLGMSSALLWGFRKNIFPSAGARILPEGLKKDDSPEQKGRVIAHALKLAGAKKESDPRYMDFVAACANGLVSRSLKGLTYTVHGLQPVQVRIFGTELYKMGIRVIRVEMGYAVGVANVSDPNGGRGSLLPNTLIFRVYYEPGCIKEGEVENVDVTSLPETVMQAIPLPCPASVPWFTSMPAWPLTAANPYGNDVY